MGKTDKFEQMVANAKDRKEKVEQKLEQVEKQLEENEEMLEIAEKYNNDLPDTAEEIEELYSILCWDNIAFCCSTDKPCPMRDYVLYIIGVTKDDFEEEKSEFGFELAGGRINVNK